MFRSCTYQTTRCHQKAIIWHGSIVMNYLMVNKWMFPRKGTAARKVKPVLRKVPYPVEVLRTADKKRYSADNLIGGLA